MRRSPRSVRRTQGILGGRSQQVVQRVLAAALVELARSGYADFRLEAVASRAAVNKTTLYRRWPGRAALVSALVAQLRTPLRERPLPDTGELERDLVEAFSRRFTLRKKTEGRAWARLLDERYNPEVAAIIKATVLERRKEWLSMVTRGVERGELPRGTNAQLLLDLVRAIVDSRPSVAGLNGAWLTTAVRTVVAGARAGALVKSRRKGASVPSATHQKSA